MIRLLYISIIVGVLASIAANGAETDEKASPLLVPSGEPVANARPFLGCWENTNTTGHYLWLLGNKCVQIMPSSPWPRGDPVEYRKGSLLLGTANNQREWSVVIEKARLVMVSGKTELQFKRLADVPVDIAKWHTPLPIGKPIALPKDRVKAISSELARRHSQDQKARAAGWGNEDAIAEAEKIDEENHVYLSALVKDIGWPDTARFDSLTTYHAYMLAMHVTHDWRLMQAILPEIEREVRSGRFDAKLFIALHYRARLFLGEPDRFGLIQHDPKTGKPFVGQLENHERVDEWRAQIGLPKLAEELANTPPLSRDMIRRLNGRTTNDAKD